MGNGKADVTGERGQMIRAIIYLSITIYLSTYYPPSRSSSSTSHQNKPFFLPFPIMKLLHSLSAECIPLARLGCALDSIGEGPFIAYRHQPRARRALDRQVLADPAIRASPPEASLSLSATPY